MRRIFSAKRNALLSSTDVSWGVIALVFVLFVLALRLVAPDLFWGAMRPVFGVADVLAGGTHALLSGFADTAMLSATNERLVAENAALTYQNQTLLRKEADLMALLGAASPDKKGIVAGVLVRPPESPYDAVVVNAGTADGVTLGMEAFGESGTPVGVVSTIQTNTARVTLFSAPGTSVGGWAGKSSVPITIHGTGASGLSASVPRSAGIAAGDTVFLPGPGLLPAGVVERVDGDPSAPTVTLRIRADWNAFSLAWVTLRDSGTDLLSALPTATSTLP